MRTLSPFFITGALALVTTTRAQNPVVITGHVTPCAGTVYEVHVQSFPGLMPVLDTVVQTGTDCGYYLMYWPISTNGFISASTSCDSGLTYMSDSAYFDIGLLGTDTVVMDMACGVPVIDCNGVPNGTASPGTACDDGDPDTWNDLWSVDCICQGGIYDCAGYLNGTNVPGTPCMLMEADSIWYFGTWSPQCVCVPDSDYTDCAGTANGPALPGTPCDDGNPLTHDDAWDISCMCVGQYNAPCQALFTVVQALGTDSVLIPNDLWLYSQCQGGNGPLTYLWDFGDGETSTEAQPVHTYAGNGPYWLCVTVDDGFGCTDTYCDSVSVDENGIISGMSMNRNSMAGDALRRSLSLLIVVVIVEGAHDPLP